MSTCICSVLFIFVPYMISITIKYVIIRTLSQEKDFKFCSLLNTDFRHYSFNICFVLTWVNGEDRNTENISSGTSLGSDALIEESCIFHVMIYMVDKGRSIRLFYGIDTIQRLQLSWGSGCHHCGAKISYTLWSLRVTAGPWCVASLVSSSLMMLRKARQGQPSAIL